MKTTIFVALLALSSANAFALTNNEIAQACQERGAQKIAEQAAAWNCQVQGSVTVQSVDNRWYNPSKYVWFSVPAQCPNGLESITKLVQFYRGKCI